MSGRPAEAWLGRGQDPHFCNPSCQHRLPFKPISALSPSPSPVLGPSQNLNPGYTELQPLPSAAHTWPTLHTTNATYWLALHPSLFLLGSVFLVPSSLNNGAEQAVLRGVGLRAGQKGGLLLRLHIRMQLLIYCCFSREALAPLG